LSQADRQDSLGDGDAVERTEDRVLAVINGVKSIRGRRKEKERAGAGFWGRKREKR
jgi:hypothetical protein